MVEPLAQPQPSRAERKERTRRALLEATLDLLDERGFAGLSLREVARAAGIVPTAFYRHFASLDDLGVSLAEESMRLARRLFRDARRGGEAPAIADVVALLARRVREHPREFRFLVRERHGGSAEVRRAIDAELRATAGELAIDLARRPELAAWPADDLETASSLLIGVALEAVPELLDPPRHRSDGSDAAVDRAVRRLRMVALGMAAWRPGD